MSDTIFNQFLFLKQLSKSMHAFGKSQEVWLSLYHQYSMNQSSYNIV